MSKFNVVILGNASASPTLKRNHSAQLVNVNEQYYLVDCGEGTQLRLKEQGIKLQRINHIFISHLHGDHYLGLIGLIQTMHLLGRTTQLSIYCPSKIEEIIDVHLKFSFSKLNYPINYVDVNNTNSEVIFENDKLQVSSIPLKHKIPCSGYLFQEKQKPRRINPKAIERYKVPKFTISSLKLGEDFLSKDGEIIKNEKLTFNSLPSYSYAYCSDTCCFEKIIPIIKGVNLLYHEATFSEEHSDRASKTLHSTAKQAGQIALKSESKMLIIGHFSNRYTNLTVLLNEAKQEFENTQLAEQGKIFDVATAQ